MNKTIIQNALFEIENIYIKIGEIKAEKNLLSNRINDLKKVVHNKWKKFLDKPTRDNFNKYLMDSRCLAILEAEKEYKTSIVIIEYKRINLLKELILDSK